MAFLIIFSFSCEQEKSQKPLWPTNSRCFTNDLPEGFFEEPCNPDIFRNAPGSCTNLRDPLPSGKVHTPNKVVEIRYYPNFCSFHVFLFRIAALEINLPHDSWESLTAVKQEIYSEDMGRILGYYSPREKMISYSHVVDNRYGQEKWSPEHFYAILIHEVFHHYQYLLGYGGGHPEEIFGHTGSRLFSEFKNNSSSPMARMEKLALCTARPNEFDCNQNDLGLSNLQYVWYQDLLDTLVR